MPARTIRFQESWLVVLSARGQGGFRLYTDGDGARAAAIRRLKSLKFSLEEMREVLGLLDEVTGRAPTTDAPPTCWWSG
jgi:MerR family copper efflux transcriptional regulator